MIVRKELKVAALSLFIVCTSGATEVWDKCKDKRRACEQSAQDRQCLKNPDVMYRLCPLSCKVCEMMERSEEFGVKQDMLGWESYSIYKVVKQIQQYIGSDKVLELKAEIYLNCWNRDKDCSMWALQGECEKNVVWMEANCAPACQSCHNLSMESLETAGVDENRVLWNHWA
jgi:prolyl 4-hydroxylase